MKPANQVSLEEGRRLLSVRMERTYAPRPGKGRIRTRKEQGMNKEEEAYSWELMVPKGWGLTGNPPVWHRFEGITLKLADDTRYTPDFLVQLYDGSLECHEVKAWWPAKNDKPGRVGWREDARIKIKVAAAQFPFKFIAVWRRDGAWEREEF